MSKVRIIYTDEYQIPAPYLNAIGEDLGERYPGSSMRNVKFPWKSNTVGIQQVCLIPVKDDEV